MSLSSNQLRDLSITSRQDVTIDRSKNYASLFTIKNFDLKELNLTIQYLALLNQDQVGLFAARPDAYKPFVSKTLAEKLNIKLLKLYYHKESRENKKFKMRVLYSIIFVLILDLIQLYSIEQLSDKTRIKSSLLFGVIH